MNKILIYSIIGLIIISASTIVSSQISLREPKFVIYCNGYPVGSAQIPRENYNLINSYIQTASISSSQFTIALPDDNEYDVLRTTSSLTRKNCPDIERILNEVERIMRLKG